MIPEFRVWDKVNKKMIYINNADISIDFFGDGSFEVYDCDIGDYRGNNDTLILMRYTGLKGKKGKKDKKIFEGDVLGSFIGGMIRYCEKCKEFTIFYSEEEDSCLSCSSDLHWWELVNMEKEGKLEIIGNRYENPELLEDR